MQRKKYSAQFKAKVAIEAVKGNKTVNDIAGEYGVHPTQIQRRKFRFQVASGDALPASQAAKKQLLEELPNIFSRKRASKAKETEELTAQLYQQIGQRTRAFLG